MRHIFGQRSSGTIHASGSGQRGDQQHAHDDAAGDAVHTRTCA
jgi:hypothetical protein